MHKNENKSDKFNYLLIVAVVAFLAMVAVWWKYLAHFYPKPISDNSADWGTFGDYVGGVLNPILSFLALIGLFFTIKLQAKEMEAARQEMEYTREELKRSAQSQEKQSEIFNRQQFETTFISLLEQHNSALEKISGNASEIIRSIFNKNSNSKDKWSYKNGSKLKSLYLEPRIHHDNLNVYFRILYQILNYIALHIPNGKLNEENFSEKMLLEQALEVKEKTYSDIVCSFIPEEVLQLLAISISSNFVNSENKKDSENTEDFLIFRALLCRYAVLEHMPFIVNYSDAKYSFVLFRTIRYYSSEEEKAYSAYGKALNIRKALKKIEAEKKSYEDSLKEKRQQLNEPNNLSKSGIETDIKSIESYLGYLECCIQDAKPLLNKQQHKS